MDFEREPSRRETVPGIPLGDPYAWGRQFAELETADDFDRMEQMQTELIGPDEAREFEITSVKLSYLGYDEGARERVAEFFDGEERLREFEARLAACTTVEEQRALVAGLASQKQKAGIVEIMIRKYLPKEGTAQ